MLALGGMSDCMLCLCACARMCMCAYVLVRVCVGVCARARVFRNWACALVSVS